MAELIFDGILMILLVAFLVIGAQIPRMSSASDIAEASGFPMLFSIIAIILLCIEIISFVRKMKKVHAGEKEDASSASLDWNNAWRVGLIIVLTVAYILLVRTLGFVLISLIYTVCCFFLLGSKRKLFNVVFSFAAVAVLTLIFGRFFGISLPRGAGILKTLSFYLY